MIQTIVWNIVKRGDSWFWKGLGRVISFFNFNLILFERERACEQGRGLWGERQRERERERENLKHTPCS